LVPNKMDDTPTERVIELAQTLNDEHDYDATFMIAGLKRYGVDVLMDYLRDALPKAPWMFPDDQLSDQPMRFMAAEITREKIYDRLHKELPYAAMVETYEWEDFDNGDVRISQNILIQRPSQKAIVLGKGGASIKEIGKMAREELEGLLDRRVHLKLFVKVEKNWPDKPQFYTGPGLEYPNIDSKSQ
jgi:GTP-binding protein Era